MNARRRLAGLGLGRTAYHLWHRPAAAVRRSAAAGGPWQQWRDFCGRRAMERTAGHVAPATGPVAGGMPDLHFLTGKRFWYQTVFCLRSLEVRAGARFRVHFHDDGTLSPALTSRLAACFPQARFHSRAEMAEHHERTLPPARYPSLDAVRRLPYLNLLKFTSVHAGGRGWHLVLDSDMLFFRRPDLLLDWMEAPAEPICLTDVASSYGYPPATMAGLAGAPIPERINVGLLGLDSEGIDWDRVESWTRELLARHGMSYYLEQALVAMLVAGGLRTALPAADYVIMPDPAQCQNPRETLHHYVAGSKRGYFRHAWRHALR